MAEVTVSTDVTPDPNAVPAKNIIGDANKVIVDPTKATETKSEEKLILGKYKTQADLEKAHVELEKKLGEKAAPAVTPEQAREAVQKAGLDMTAITKEYADNRGKLSEATLKSLDDKGIPRAAVDTYISGLQAQATQMRAEFAQIAGSEDVLKSVLEWASTNGDPGTIKAYNDAIESNNVAVAKLALQSLGASYNDAVGTDPALIGGDASADSGGVQPYTSSAQVQAAIRDPRYKEDEAYRQAHYKRMDKTSLFTVRSGSR